MDREPRPTPARLCVGLALVWSVGAGGVAAQDSLGLEQLAARATPAVVLIDVQTAADRRQGSGFLVDPTGRILTNHHVIRNARSARVRLPSGDVYEEVRILAEDMRRDLAVLQISGFDLPWLELGNSDSVQVGSSVVLIGSPLGLENTVSAGIVSGRRREPEGYQLIQVSAAASRGSSGGAVLDAKGRVIGVAVSQMEGGQNLNFAVPVNYARGLLEHLGPEPVAVLSAITDGVAVETAGAGAAGAGAAGAGAAPAAPMSNAVNRAFSYSGGNFAGFRRETRTVLEPGLQRQARSTYRLIESIGPVEPRIELYREVETTRRTEPFGTVLTLHRERSRVVVSAEGLTPISSTGESSWWNGIDWVTARHDLRFEGNHVVGIVSDTTGSGMELDRDLPPGIVLHDMRDLAFALLEADSLVGRSVEFVTFDAETGAIEHERFDIRDTVTVRVGGEPRRGLEVNVARGLDNETVVVRADRPRVVLQRVSGDGSETEEVTHLEIFGGKARGSSGGTDVALLDLPRSSLRWARDVCARSQLSPTQEVPCRPSHEPLSRR
jgi:S1-C subfamily serine protease